MKYFSIHFLLSVLMLLTTLISSSQNNEVLRNQALLYLDAGKYTEALVCLNKIKDKQILENTNVNLYKAHLENIINYRFSKKTKLNDSLFKVYIKTNVLKSQGIYNSKSSKYTVAPIYDSINIPKEYYDKYLTAYKNNLITLLNIETGKSIIPLGNYYISKNQKYAFVDTKVEDSYFSFDGIISIYDLNGNLLLKDLNTFNYINTYYPNITFFSTKNKNNKVQLIDLSDKKIVLDDCDYIENPTLGIIENDITYENYWLPFKKNNKNYLYKITKNGIKDTHKFETFIPMYSNYNGFENSLSKIINIKDNETSCPDNETRNCFFSYYTIVKKENKYGIFDITKDNFYKEPIYDSITNLGNTFYKGKWINLVYGQEICIPLEKEYRGIVFKKNNLFGLMALNGKIIVEAKYDEVKPLPTDLFSLRKGTKWGFIGVQNGDKLVEPKFDLITYYIRG